MVIEWSFWLLQPAAPPFPRNQLNVLTVPGNLIIVCGLQLPALILGVWFLPLLLIPWGENPKSFS